MGLAKTDLCLFAKAYLLLNLAILFHSAATLFFSERILKVKKLTFISIVLATALVEF